MAVIWKFPLRVTDHQEVRVPAGAVPLSVGLQDGMLTAWVLVDPLAPTVTHPVWVVGTGNTIDSGVDVKAYLGTVQAGSFIWHVFWTWDPDSAVDAVPAMESAALDIAAAAADIRASAGGGTGWAGGMAPGA